MTSILIKKAGGGPESIFSYQGGLRGKMFENHCTIGLVAIELQSHNCSSFGAYHFM
jgi:hypothetical protein